MNTSTLTRSVAAPSAEAYCDSRRKDYGALLQEISDGKGDLGYCVLNGCNVTIRGSVQSFKSNIAAKAWILRNFW